MSLCLKLHYHDLRAAEKFAAGLHGLAALDKLKICLDRTGGESLASFAVGLPPVRVLCVTYETGPAGLDREWEWGHVAASSPCWEPWAQRLRFLSLRVRHLDPTTLLSLAGLVGLRRLDVMCSDCSRKGSQPALLAEAFPRLLWLVVGPEALELVRGWFPAERRARVVDRCVPFWSLQP